jgi:hypothetical protein
MALPGAVYASQMQRWKVGFSEAAVDTASSARWQQHAKQVLGGHQHWLVAQQADTSITLVPRPLLWFLDQAAAIAWNEQHVVLML